MFEESVVVVHIPPELRPYTQGHDEVMASGDTVQDVLESLDHEHPGVLAHVILASGKVDPSLEVWLGGSRVDELQGLSTPVGLEEVVSLLPAE
jgi:molybdopterin converting factor small subunit